MAITIESDEGERLARRLAEVTGTTVTEAVAEAIRSRLLTIGDAAAVKQARLVAMRAAAARLQAQVAALPVLDARPADELFYDAFGLPH